MNSPQAPGVVEAVCVLHAERDSGTRRVTRTAIDKRPIHGPVQVDRAGLAGDYVCDTEHHGGRFKAVYAYDAAEAARWEHELDRTLPFGWFGENLRISGMPITDAVIGERWRIGSAVHVDSGDGATELEVTGPRTPCGTFGVWAQEPRWVARFSERGDTGAYLSVVQPGPVCAGDTVHRVFVPEHGVTVRDLFTGRDLERFADLLDQQKDLSPTVAEKARKRMAGLEVRVMY